MSRVTITFEGELLPTLEFVGQPVPNEGPRKGRGGRFYTPTRTREYRASLAEIAVDRWGEKEPTRKPVGMVTVFQRRGKKLCDVDNLHKSVQDALLGLAYVDDSQVQAIIAIKQPEAKEPGAQIMVMVLKGVNIEISEEDDGKRKAEAKGRRRRKVARPE